MSCTRHKHCYYVYQIRSEGYQPMDDIFKSNRFLLTTILLDVFFLGVINSAAFPIPPSPVLAGFVLLILSPGIAYAITRYLQSEE